MPRGQGFLWFRYVSTVELDDVVRVPPNRFGSSLENVALELLKLKYESTINPDYGYLVLVTNVKVDKIGKIIPGDGATYHKVKFEVFAFLPSQTGDNRGRGRGDHGLRGFREDRPHGRAPPPQPDNGRLPHQRREVGRNHRIAVQEDLKVGSKVRVRITAVSLGHGISMGKIGVTCRQPFLGALEWIDDEVAKAAKTAKAEARAS